ncbi:Nuclear pore subcomplexes subunit [Komagataella phaffii]|uniref:Essential nucleoporin n=1 Tax=Komagataella phaffii (strain GS115 / ATCC 20864) TaxID=644223 RepID=C4R1Z6_KOMPG|nr:Essential nucleoporin [Komagataella phaffii GS115]AOA62771.1 GQ67_00941T0 [Komagataella phaffii]AOA67446.1 GQ68_00448T0 [Komagataella phaffii GS115]CAH2447935.1 Nuclear pore subcomplexes subunit [Komagataella phaffii CBS 7435]CAY69520.1 Essential nucleoporin [Komagataella phaffii GS115]
MFGFGNQNSNTVGKTGSLFGNNASSSTFGGPSQVNNNIGFQNPAPVTSNTSTNFSFGNRNPSNSNSLFGGSGNQQSNATSGGIFGTNTTSGGGLFGNSASTGSNPSVGLFGNKGSSNNNDNTGSLFGVSNNTTKSGGLFSNANSGLSLTQGNNKLQSTQSNSVNGNENPYGLVLGSLLSTKDMPKSLTSSNSPTLSHRQEANNLKFTYQPHSSTSKSSILANLGKSFHVTNSSKSRVQFGTSIHNKDDRQPAKRNAEQTSVQQSFQSPGHDFKRLVVARISDTPSNFYEVNLDDILRKRRKLAIKHDDTMFRKTILSQNFDGENLPHKPRRIATITSEVERKDNKAQNIKEDGYWSSPSIEVLSQLDTEELASVENLIIGRIGYGQVAFEQPVDLRDFKYDLQGSLFGKAVIFKRKVIQVYSDWEEKPQIGSGLNVPAIITLEKCYPLDPVTRKPNTDPSNLDISSFITKLKSFNGMNYISYSPISGTWVFGVEHFSIWGIVEEDDLEIEPDLKLKFQKQQEAENLNAIKKQKVPNNQFFGTKFHPEDSLDSLDHYKSPLELGTDNHSDSDGLLNTTEDELNEPNEFPDGLVSVKPYEPSVEDVDLKLIDVTPDFQTSKDWERQFELAFDTHSAFSYSSTKGNQLPNNLTHARLDALLFGDPEKAQAYKTEIQSNLKFNNGYPRFIEWTDDGKILTNNNDNSFVAELVDVSSHFSFDHNKATAQALRSMISHSNITTKDGLPQFTTNDSFTFAELNKGFYTTSGVENLLWNLCSNLFDNCNLEAPKKVIDNKRREDLISWLREINGIEIERLMLASNNDPLEKVFVHVVGGDIESAIMESVRHGNNHLASLITLLGSFDFEVCQLATEQLRDWWRSSSWKLIPQPILKIYQLLSGRLLEDNLEFFVDCFEGLSWSLALQMFLSYGDLNKTLAESLAHFNSAYTNVPSKDIFYSILKLYSQLNGTEGDQLNSIYCSFNDSIPKKLDAKIPWFIYEVLIRSKGKRDCLYQGDVITLAFAEQLHISGQIQESIFVLLHLENFKELQLLIEEVITKTIGNLKLKEGSSSAFERTLLETYHLPSYLIGRASATYYSYRGDHLNQVTSLLAANSSNEAHDVLLTYVAPNAIIQGGDQLAQLSTILAKFRDLDVDRWHIGGEVYQIYLKLLNTSEGNDVQDYMVVLLERLPQMETHNFSMKVALAIISKAIGHMILKLKPNLAREKLLNLPFHPSDLSYFRKSVGH